MPLNLVNEVHPVSECERNVCTNSDTKQVLENDGNFQSESTSTLAGIEVLEQQARRAVNESVAEEGICGIIADSIGQKIDGIERTSTDKYPEGASKEVISEETSSGAIDACVALTAIYIGSAESRYRGDQSSAEGIFASRCPDTGDALNEISRDKSDVVEAPSIIYLQEFVPNTALQSCTKEQGAYSPDRLSINSVGTSVLDMASTFDDLTGTDESCSTDNCNE